MDSSMDPSFSAEQELDTEISSIRTEIQNLRKRKSFLSSSLLSSDRIQKRLRREPSEFPQDENTSISISPLVESAGKHSESNHHRVAFGVTAFPFRDPSSRSRDSDGDDKNDSNLLGIRIDVCTRTGQFVKPYYVLLRRDIPQSKTEGTTAMTTTTHLRVHRHTIPAFISMEKLERIHLPFVSEKPPHRKQDLHAFVKELRKQLVSWHLRMDVVDMLREELSLPSDDSTPGSPEMITSISPTAQETRYIRLEWQDGRVGRFKISDSGLVERAVVIGDDEGGRDGFLEDLLTGRYGDSDGNGRVEGVVERLREG